MTAYERTITMRNRIHILASAAFAVAGMVFVANSTAQTPQQRQSETPSQTPTQGVQNDRDNRRFEPQIIINRNPTTRPGNVPTTQPGRGQGQENSAQGREFPPGQDNFPPGAPTTRPGNQPT